MSVPFGRAVLTLDDITKQIRRTFEQFADPRRGRNTRYTLVDAGFERLQRGENAVILE